MDYFLANLFEGDIAGDIQIDYVRIFNKKKSFVFVSCYI